MVTVDVLFMQKKELNATQILSLTNTSKYSDHTFISITSNNKKRVVIGVYYRHNSHTKSDILGFIDKFESHIKHKTLKNSKLVITGDINLNLLQISTKPKFIF